MHTWNRCLLVALAASVLLTATACSKQQDTASSSSNSASSAAQTEASSSSASSAETESNTETSLSASGTDADAQGTAVETQPKAELPTESDIKDMTYDLEYESDDVPEACADAIATYFYAIETQNFQMYRSSLYTPYADQIDAWLQENYGYGLETALESFHQMLTDNAGTEQYHITAIEMTPAQPASEEDSNFLDDYLTTYNSILGDTFSKEVSEDADQVWDIAVTLKADCDGTEKELITGNEVLMVGKDGVYTILG